LGIGRVQGEIGGIRREWLAWHDEDGKPYPLSQELIQQLERELIEQYQRAAQMEQFLEQERQRAAQMEQALEQERLEKLRLLEQLRRLGVDLNE
jgi:hypothetical protein